jgi:hypothetical protein
VATAHVYMGGGRTRVGRAEAGGLHRGRNTRYCSDGLMGGPTHLKCVSCNWGRVAFLARAHLSVRPRQTCT